MATDTVSRTPTLAETIDNAIETGLASCHVALPCSVQSYNAATQTVNVQPLLKLPVTDADGVTTAQARPVINNVPVQFPCGGQMRITFPIAAGDTGMLLFADQSLDIYLSIGGNVDPIDLRTHSLSDAIFIPGVNPNPRAWHGADPSVITIGSDTGTPDFVATASRVLAQLTSVVNSFNTHTHLVSAFGSPSSPPAIPMAAPSAPASATVKILG